MNETKRELLNDRVLRRNLDSINKVHTYFDEHYECIVMQDVAFNATNGLHITRADTA